MLVEVFFPPRRRLFFFSSAGWLVCVHREKSGRKEDEEGEIVNVEERNMYLCTTSFKKRI